MKILLDTHVLIWAVEMPSKLGRRAKAALLDPSSNLLISPISTLELAQLASKKRISFTSTVEAWVNSAIGQLRLESAEITHAVSAGAYVVGPDFQGDPADRILVSTCRSIPAFFMTADREILEYPGVRSIDARR